MALFIDHGKLLGLSLVVISGLFAGTLHSARADSPRDDDHPAITLQKLWRKQTGDFGAGAAEIVAYDKETQRLFVTNFQKSSVDVLKILGGATAGTLDVSDLGSPNSAATHDGLVAVAIEAPEKTDAGAVAFFSASSLKRLAVVPVGAQPDMLTFTADGKKVVVANEGEPNDAYTIDPEGSLSIIDVSRGATRATVATAHFRSFNSRKARLIAAGVRIFGPESTIDEPDDRATVAQDLEPEYISIEGRTAYVTLQEANAVATVDIQSATVTDIHPLGVKNHRRRGNELDASDRDSGVKIKTWPVQGMYLPDAIATYRVGKRTYIVTANEGDTRDWEGFSEEERVGGIQLDAVAFPDAAELQKVENLGRLKVTSTRGGRTVVGPDGEETTVYNALYSFGTRSFSIWTAGDDGKLVQVFDSGSDFERITAALVPEGFNSDNTANDTFDTRSDDKGPEPEALALGTIDGRTYAFIGLERIGGIMIYDVTDPEDPMFVDYTPARNFRAPLDRGNHSDAGPECVVFIPADDNPLRMPLLVTANEISSTATLYRVRAAHKRDSLDDLLDALGSLLSDWLPDWSGVGG